MSKLKSCPFCGGEAMAVASKTSQEDKFWGCEHFGVCCRDPECIGYDLVPRYRTSRHAIEAWNRRAPNEQTEA